MKWEFHPHEPPFGGREMGFNPGSRTGNPRTAAGSNTIGEEIRSAGVRGSDLGSGGNRNIWGENIPETYAHSILHASFDKSWIGKECESFYDTLAGAVSPLQVTFGLLEDGTRTALAEQGGRMASIFFTEPFSFVVLVGWAVVPIVI